MSVKNTNIIEQVSGKNGVHSLKCTVALPDGQDSLEWIASYTVDFYKQVNILYGTISEFCTDSTCPVMSAGTKYEYYWADGLTIKKPLKCTAPQYIDYLITWIESQIDDESIFPSKLGQPFPSNFISIVKVILKRLFRVYAHVYYKHFSKTVELQETKYLNISFKHFILFVKEFDLIDDKELLPMQECIDRIMASS